MQTKLTLRIDDAVIERAKAYSRVSGKSVSQIVADYLALLPSRPDEQSARLTPTVRSLRGLLRGANVDEADYRRHLEAARLAALERILNQSHHLGGHAPLRDDLHER